MKHKNSKKIILHFALSFYALIFAFCVFTKDANAATLYFSPSKGNFTVGNLLSTSVLVNTQEEAINNSDATINFPAGLLEVISVSKAGSVFSLWVEEPAFSNSAGTITFNGGSPTPGFNGTSGKIVSIVFRVKSAGSASLIFSSAAVRANDGYGTDILQARAQAQFNLVAVGVPSPAIPRAVGTPEAPKISSPTHPDSNKWYSNNNPKFVWEIPSGITGVRLFVDRSPKTAPTTFYPGPVSERQVESLADGIWYFHAQLRNQAGWGEGAHFKFQVDAGKPSRFEIKLVPREDLTEQKVKFIFDAHDEMSGISHYEIEIDNRAQEIWVDDGSGIYATPPLQSGKRVLVARAVDKAGNFLTNSVTFTIEAPAFFKYSYLVIGYLSIIIPLLALIVLLLLLIWYALRKHRDHKRRMRKEIQEVEKSVQEAFNSLRKDVREQIKFLEKLKTTRQLSEEEDRIMNQLKKDLDSAERIISKEVEDVKKEEG